VKVGDLVRTNGHPHAKGYPTGHGIVVDHRDEGLHEMYNTVYVMWPSTGEKRSVRQMFLEVISESR
jgi:hypothetical protein